MRFKPFFVHYHQPNMPPQAFTGRYAPHFQGFTAYVVPADEGEVSVQVTLCSTNDHFCYETGRSSAINSTPFYCRAIDVPHHMQELRGMCEFNFDSDTEDPVFFYDPVDASKQYDYLYKYMV